MSISEQVAYLKGLFDGMDFEDTKETRMLEAIVDVLDSIALEIEELQENDLDLGEEIDILSDDLAVVEEELFGDDDEDDYLEDFDDEVLYEVKCPSCEEVITINEGILDLGSIECPNCGEDLEFELDEDDIDEE